MAFRGITKRWVNNCLVIIAVLLIVFDAAVVIYAYSYYKNSVRRELQASMNMVESMLSYHYDSINRYADDSILNIVENFSERDKIELIIIDKSGVATLSSSGFTPNKYIEIPDFEAAKASGNRGEYIGKDYNGERIYALCMLLPTDVNSSFSAIRLIVSMENTELQVLTIIIALLLITAIILILVAIVNLRFIRTLVRPINKIGATAREIATGDFDVRIQHKSNDEIGELSEIINDMASELSQSNKLKNDFISSVSHELRTPLTSIKGWGETLMNEVGSDTFKRGIGIIISETERLSQMVEELLDFSRMQSGRMVMAKEKIDILSELDDAVIVFADRSRRENVEIVYEYSQKQTYVFGDKNRLRQVFVNIIDNSLKYSGNGGKIKIETFERYGFIYICISDNGCGIDVDDLPNVKARFYKGNSARRGSGIGLAVADEIIHQHGGTLEVESEQNIGTTVTIAIPIIDAKNTEDNINDN